MVCKPKALAAFRRRGTVPGARPLGPVPPALYTIQCFGHDALTHRPVGFFHTPAQPTFSMRLLLGPGRNMSRRARLTSWPAAAAAAAHGIRVVPHGQCAVEGPKRAIQLRCAFFSNGRKSRARRSRLFGHPVRAGGGLARGPRRARVEAHRPCSAPPPAYHYALFTSIGPAIASAAHRGRK